MKRIIILLSLILLLGIDAVAQKTNDTDIIGIWQVVEATTSMDLPEEQQQNMEILKTAFLKSIFTFESDHNFSFDFEFQEMKIVKAHWKYNDTKESIIIQEWPYKDGNDHVLMKIHVKEKNGQLFFLIDETFFSLEVQKK